MTESDTAIPGAIAIVVPTDTNVAKKVEWDEAAVGTESVERVGIVQMAETENICRKCQYAVKTSEVVVAVAVEDKEVVLLIM